MNHQIKTDEIDCKYVEVTVTLKVYLDDDAESEGFLSSEEVSNLLMDKDRVDLGECVLNAFNAEAE